MNSIPFDESHSPMASIRLATPPDHDTIVAIVNAAYEKYIPRIGKKPAPMLDDYARLITNEVVYVLEAQEGVRGVLVLWTEQHHILLENIAIAPDAQGRGYGKQLMQFAESFARAQGKNEIRLYTNQAMYENIEIYKHLGFTDTERRYENGYNRVYLSKSLSK
jgi:ribosomal protein S18 acetylase RimI-like enzyme